VVAANAVGFMRTRMATRTAEERRINILSSEATGDLGGRVTTTSRMHYAHRAPVI
jgi:hypothetical protein